MRRFTARKLENQTHTTRVQNKALHSISEEIGVHRVTREHESVGDNVGNLYFGAQASSFKIKIILVEALFIEPRMTDGGTGPYVANPDIEPIDESYRYNILVRWRPHTGGVTASREGSLIMKTSPERSWSGCLANSCIYCASAPRAYAIYVVCGGNVCELDYLSQSQPSSSRR